MDFVNIANDNQPLLYYIEKLQSATDCQTLLMALETVSTVPELENSKTKDVKIVQFDMHIAKAEQKMRDLCVTIRTKWMAVRNIVLVHRIGYVLPTCPYSFVGIIGYDSHHVRQAVEFAAIELKKFPIWKEETYTDDSRCWTSTHECFWRMNADERDEMDRLQACALAKAKAATVPSSADIKPPAGCSDPKCCVRNGHLPKTAPDISTSVSKNVL